MDQNGFAAKLIEVVVDRFALIQRRLANVVLRAEQFGDHQSRLSSERRLLEVGSSIIDEHSAAAASLMAGRL